MSRGRLSGWRKIATAVWKDPDDPQIYGALDIRARPLLGFIERAREHGHQVTPTHIVGRAVAHALAAVPELNVRLVGDHAIPRESVDVFFITSVGRGRELTGVKVTHIDEKSALEVASELRDRGREMKRGNDRELALAKAMLHRLPGPVLRVGLRAVSWAVGVRAWNLPFMGLAAVPFGSAMVSSVGMFGIPLGFAPLVWLYRVPLMVLAGEIEERPVAVDGRVEVQPVLPIGATADHRYVDGAHLGQALSAFRRYLEAPAHFEPSFESSSAIGADAGAPLATADA
jgi:pyruvate/2-oxoglutarate dehydrogenase complex dihydrolipoamide acyltransferase (E2) component